jgi:hypothetical protein
MIFPILLDENYVQIFQCLVLFFSDFFLIRCLNFSVTRNDKQEIENMCFFLFFPFIYHIKL